MLMKSRCLLTKQRTALTISSREALMRVAEVAAPGAAVMLLVDRCSFEWLSLLVF